MPTAGRSVGHFFQAYSILLVCYFGNKTTIRNTKSVTDPKLIYNSLEGSY